MFSVTDAVVPELKVGPVSSALVTFSVIVASVELPTGTTWRTEGFNGAVLLYRDLCKVDDPHSYLLDLFRGDYGEAYFERRLRIGEVHEQIGDAGLEPRLDVGPRVAGRALAAVLSIFQVLRKNELLEPILWKVVEKPSLLSIAANFGVDVSITPQFDKIDIDPRALPGRPGDECIHRFPIQFVVNGGVALRSTLSVVESRFPLRVGAGMLAADGVHPRDPDKRVSVRLLASRRGPAEPENLPAN